ncbi:hypothetical protein OROHE_008547 [Orobanche hederae]
MADFPSIGLLCLLLFFTLSSVSSGHHKPKTPKIIKEACKASRTHGACKTWLSSTSNHVLPPNATILQVIQTALNDTTQNLHKGGVRIRNILNASAGNLTWSSIAATCKDMVRYSEYRINLVGQALASRQIKDARACMSAALGYQYGCFSSLKYMNYTPLVADTMAFFNNSLIQQSSTALGMIVNYDIFGNNTKSWGPARTERDNFWEHDVSNSSGSSRSGSVGGVPTWLKADVTVCKDGGSCEYKTVQEAVNAAPNNTAGPGKRFVIRIKAGVYSETVRVPLEKKNVVFLGDGVGKTVINGSRNVGQPGMTTYNSATVGVVGDGFMASNLTIQNTAGPDAHQAVALLLDSDHSIMENCEFIGNQDTLCALSLRQYYKSCTIQGNVDFIFGNSAAVFQDCLILVAPRQLSPESGETNTVTAHGRTDPAQSTGFVFWNSVINGTKSYMDLYNKNKNVHKNYLGRPWKEYSRTIFIQCTLEALISQDGWMPWDGDFALNTLYYGEFNNTGDGSSRSKRVAWSSQIPSKHVGSYSAQNFIQASSNTSFN